MGVLVFGAIVLNARAMPQVRKIAFGSADKRRKYVT